MTSPTSPGQIQVQYKYKIHVSVGSTYLEPLFVIQLPVILLLMDFSIIFLHHNDDVPLPAVVWVGVVWFRFTQSRRQGGFASPAVPGVLHRLAD